MTNGGSNEINESILIKLYVLIQIDCPGLFSVETGIDQFMGIREVSPIEKIDLNVILERPDSADHALMGENRRAPLPFLYYARIGLMDQRTKPGHHLGLPTFQPFDERVNLF